MDKLPRPYRPGKAPVFAANDDDEESPFSRAPEVKKKSASSSSSQVVAEVVMAPAPEKADRRLNRIREPVDRSEALVERHRRHHDTVAEIVAVPVVEEPKRPEPQAPIATTPAAVPEAEEDPEARRERIRRQMKEQEQQEELPVAEEQEEESEYEEEEASDDEGAGGITALPPPLFVPKAARETIAERDRLQKEEEEREAARLKGLEDRKGESRNMLIEAIKKDKEEEQAAQSDAEPENEGELDEAKEIELWKIRELKRIKREREERDQKEREKEEIEKRRGLTDAQVSELDKDRLKPKEKEKWKFLQKCGLLFITAIVVPLLVYLYCTFADTTTVVHSSATMLSSRVTSLRRLARTMRTRRFCQP
jgi:microfibrillar-associated protein 1